MNDQEKVKLLAKDLSKSAPRSARDTLAGCVIAARTLDKYRAVLAWAREAQAKLLCGGNRESVRYAMDDMTVTETRSLVIRDSS